MTKPDGPGQAGTNGRPAAAGGVEQPSAVTDEVPAITDEQPAVTDPSPGVVDPDPAVPDPAAVDPAAVDPAAVDPVPGAVDPVPGAPDQGPVNAEQMPAAAAPPATDQIPPVGVPEDPGATSPGMVQRDDPVSPAPQSDAGTGEPRRYGRPTDTGRPTHPSGGSANGSASGLSSAVPPWQRTGSPVHEAETTAVGLQVAQPEHPQGGTQPKADPRPSGPAYGHSPSFGPASGAPSRYGRPVAQPFNTQSRGSNQNFSQPTVRIGGRVQPEPAAAQPSGSRVRPTRIPRRASLQLRYLEPWSVLKVSLVLSVAGFLAWMVAVGVLYSILGGMGVWDQLNGTYSDLTSVNNPEAGEDLISAGGVFGVAALVGMVNIVLITAMCTVGAFIYNASADLAGGIEVTLSERD